MEKINIYCGIMPGLCLWMVGLWARNCKIRAARLSGVVGSLQLLLIIEADKPFS